MRIHLSLLQQLIAKFICAVLLLLGEWIGQKVLGENNSVMYGCHLFVSPPTDSHCRRRIRGVGNPKTLARML